MDHRRERENSLIVGKEWNIVQRSGWGEVWCGMNELFMDRVPWRHSEMMISNLMLIESIENP